MGASKSKPIYYTEAFVTAVELEESIDEKSIRNGAVAIFYPSIKDLAEETSMLTAQYVYWNKELPVTMVRPHKSYIMVQFDQLRVIIDIKRSPKTNMVLMAMFSTKRPSAHVGMPSIIPVPSPLTLMTLPRSSFMDVVDVYGKRAEWETFRENRQTIGDFPNLQAVVCEEGMSPFPHGVRSHPRLRVYVNPLDGTTPEAFPNAEYLSLKQLPYTAATSDLPKLKHLYVTVANRTNFLKSCPNLKTLHITNFETPDTITKDEFVPQVKRVSIGQPFMSDAAFSSFDLNYIISIFPNMETLTLGYRVQIKLRKQVPTSVITVFPFRVYKAPSTLFTLSQIVDATLNSRIPHPYNLLYTSNPHITTSLSPTIE